MLDANERRLDQRHRTLKGARIAFNAGQSTIDCTIKNISSQGARLQVASVVGIPNTFDLITDRGETRPCRVAWRSLKELGVDFRPEQ